MEVSLHFDFLFQPSDQMRGGTDRNQFGHRLSMFGDDDAFPAQTVQDGKTLLLEFCGIDYLHSGRIIQLYIKTVQSYFVLRVHSEQRNAI